MEFIRCFCDGDIDALVPLLATNLSFTGALHTFKSASEYLDNLRSNPPEKCNYKIISVTECGDSIAVFYDYQKADRIVKIVQLFRIVDKKIKETLVIFDSRGFPLQECTGNNMK